MDVQVQNVGALVNRLQKFDKDVYRILQREIRQGASLVAEDAKKRTPDTTALSGWGVWNRTTGTTGSRGAVQMVTGSRDLGFDGSRARRSIKPSARLTRQRRGVTGIVGRVTFTDAGGAIWSLAGSGTSGSTFVRNLNDRYGGSRWPRALTPALYDKGPQAIAQIDAAIQRAAAAVT